MKNSVLLVIRGQWFRPVERQATSEITSPHLLTRSPSRAMSQPCQHSPCQTGSPICPAPGLIICQRCMAWFQVKLIKVKQQRSVSQLLLAQLLDLNIALAFIHTQTCSCRINTWISAWIEMKRLFDWDLSMSMKLERVSKIDPEFF